MTVGCKKQSEAQIHLGKGDNNSLILFDRNKKTFYIYSRIEFFHNF